MQYDVIEKNYPLLRVVLEKGEKIYSEAGSMCFMDCNIVMTTKSSGLLKSTLSEQSWFKTVFVAKEGKGEVDFSSNVPGQILPISIATERSFVCEKASLLAYTDSVKINLKYNSIINTLFSGEGFVMQEIKGEGTAFIISCGSICKKELLDKEQIIVDTGKIIGFSSTCKLSVKTVGNIKNMLTSGHSVFHSVITGPGKVFLNSINLRDLATRFCSFCDNCKHK